MKGLRAPAGARVVRRRGAAFPCFLGADDTGTATANTANRPGMRIRNRSTAGMWICNRSTAGMWICNRSTAGMRICNDAFVSFNDTAGDFHITREVFAV
jgi:hypothetical protein